MRVAVIGGGVAGLSAAVELVERGVDTLVLEAGPRPGGKVASTREQGFLTEDGPHFMAKPLDRLLGLAGLAADVVFAQPPNTRYVHLHGRVRKAPSLSLLTQVNAPRALLEPFFARKLQDDVSLLELMVARFGRSAGTLAATLMAAGVYAGDPSRLSARDAFPRVGAMAARGSILRGAFRKPDEPRTPLWSLRDGLGSLPLALARRLGARVRLSAPVSRVEPAGSGWRIAGEPFDALVVALPAKAAAALLAPIAPGFAGAVAPVRTAPISLVHLGFPAAELPRGFGLLDADGTLQAIGTLFPSSLLPGRAPEGQALATALVGGARHPERASLPERDLVGGVVADLRRLFGVRSDPGYVRVVRHADAIPQVAPGHRDRVAAARAALAGLPPIALAGAAWDGVGIADVARSGSAAAAATGSAAPASASDRGETGA